MSVASETIAITIEDILSTLKSLETPELLKLLKAAIAETEKKSKTTTKATKATAKKSGSMPKGVIPPQLKKPRAWVEFTLNHALENGWESFTITQKKKDGTIEEIEMPASILHEGAYVYEDSVTDKTPNGKQIIHKEAMSLSKFRKESGHPTHAEFEAQYVEEETSDDAESTTSSKKSKASTVVKKTAAEKAAEMEAKKAEKEAEKEAKKAEKEAEKERKKAEKEAEKEQKKAEKEAEKEAKKAEKEQAKKPVAKAIVPAKAVKPAETKAVEKTTVVKKTTEESKPVAPVKPASKPVPKKEEVIPNDGMVHPWTFEGKKYLRNADGETWSVGSDGGIGKWIGVYSDETKKIDTTATEPEFDDEE